MLWQMIVSHFHKLLDVDKAILPGLFLKRIFGLFAELLKTYLKPRKLPSMVHCFKPMDNAIPQLENHKVINIRCSEK